MAITNFIPTVWSENLYRQLDKQYIAVSNCSRAYEGDIKEKGSVVKICGLNDITVFDYSKNTNMAAPQTLSDNNRQLVINQAKYFNFQIDDIDHAQSAPGLMDLAIHNAASALANEADSYVYSLAEEALISESLQFESAQKLVNTLIDYRAALMENNVMNSEDVVIEVTPGIAAILLKGKIELSSNNQDALEAGCLGMLCGSKIYVTNNLYREDDGEGITHRCLMRTKRAIAFAEQLSEIEAYRPELRFADAVKGLHLYGAKVVYPQEMVCLDVYVPTV